MADQWPLTMDEIAAKLRVSRRTFQDQLIALEAAHPSVEFYKVIGKARRIFFECHYETIVEALPSSKSILAPRKHKRRANRPFELRSREDVLAELERRLAKPSSKKTGGRGKRPPGRRKRTDV